ncbi:MAG TPA: hypothetical protein VHR66_13235 [Gemmataceae bacterium]|nr:hypothetical protein [Gemmataceae bacterium]
MACFFIGIADELNWGDWVAYSTYSIARALKAPSTFTRSALGKETAERSTARQQREFHSNNVPSWRGFQRASGTRIETPHFQPISFGGFGMSAKSQAEMVNPSVCVGHLSILGETNSPCAELFHYKALVLVEC